MASSDIIPCVPPALDIFSRTKIQNAILGRSHFAIKPLCAVTQPLSCLEFCHTGNSDQYRDLSQTFLQLKVQLKAEDGAALIVDNGVGVVSNLLYSLFQTFEVFLNERCVCRIDNFGYKCYLETLLNHNKQAADTHLQTGLFFLDTPEHVNSAVENNEGFVARHAALTGSKICELFGPLHCGLFDQPLLIPNGLDLRVKLTFASPDFFLWGGDANARAVLHVVDSTLHLKTVNVNPGVLIAHAKILAQCNALFPYKRKEMRSFTVAPGARSFSLNSVCQGRLPSFLCFAMIENISFNGHQQHNPFAFIHKSITNISIYVNSDEYKIGPIDFHSRNPQHASSYHQLFSTFGLNSSTSHMITPQMYSHGYFIVPIDISPDGSGHVSHTSLASNGVVRIEATFANPLDSAITCLVMLEFDGILELDSARNVYLS